MIHAILNEIMKRFETNSSKKSARFKHQAYRLVLQAFFSSKILNTPSTVLQRLSDTKKFLGQLHLSSTLQHIATIPPPHLKLSSVLEVQSLFLSLSVCSWLQRASDAFCMQS